MIKLIIAHDQFARIKEIGNPFGDEIKVGLTYNGLSLNQVGVGTTTSDDNIITALKALACLGFYGVTRRNQGNPVC